MWFFFCVKKKLISKNKPTNTKPQNKKFSSTLMNLKPKVLLCQLESCDFFGSHFVLDSTWVLFFFG